jgi:hypothetical protein
MRGAGSRIESIVDNLQVLPCICEDLSVSRFDYEVVVLMNILQAQDACRPRRAGPKGRPAGPGGVGSLGGRAERPQSGGRPNPIEQEHGVEPSSARGAAPSSAGHRSGGSAH